MVKIGKGHPVQSVSQQLDSWQPEAQNALQLLPAMKINVINYLAD